MNAPVSSVIAGAVRLLTGATVRWIGCRPEPRQRVYFGNHTSHVDAPLIWSVLPAEIRVLTRPVAAGDYWGGTNPARRLVRRLSGAVLVERDNPGPAERERQIAALLDAMGRRCSLVMFPEGTRGAGPDIAPFKSGLYHLSLHRPGLELVPVHLDNVRRILPKGEVLPVPMACCVTFGPPITLGDDEPRGVFLERAREAVRRLRPREEALC
jgi:1-acyl-sn-glycerol-3-phosphate acyltransferase